MHYGNTAKCVFAKIIISSKYYQEAFSCHHMVESAFVNIHTVLLHHSSALITSSRKIMHQMKSECLSQSSPRNCGVESVLVNVHTVLPHCIQFNHILYNNYVSVKILQNGNSCPNFHQGITSWNMHAWIPIMWHHKACNLITFPDKIMHWLKQYQWTFLYECHSANHILESRGMNIHTMLHIALKMNCIFC